MVAEVSSYYVDNTHEATKAQIAFGAQRAMRFVKDAVSGKKIDGVRYRVQEQEGGFSYLFDERFVRNIHGLLYYAPGMKIENDLRQTDSTTVGGVSVVGSHYMLGHKFFLYGKWLEGAMLDLKDRQNDVIAALEIGAAAHFGLTQREFHPWDNGNGRTARATMNAILMSYTDEVLQYNIAVPPVPIVRFAGDGNRYVRSLEAVREKGQLNPLMCFVAGRWVESLDTMLKMVTGKRSIPKAEADKMLIARFEERRERLQEFIRTGCPEVQIKNPDAHYKSYPIPNYFGGLNIVV